MEAALRYFLLLLLLPAFPLFAEEENGVAVTVQEVELPKAAASGGPAVWDKLEKTLALRLTIRNDSGEDLPAGRVRYDVIIRRYETEELENFEDSLEVPALANGEEVELDLGSFQVKGHKKVANRREYLDAIEAWKVAITHLGVETVSAVSGNKYERLSKALAQRKK